MRYMSNPMSSYGYKKCVDRRSRMKVINHHDNGKYSMNNLDAQMTRG